MATKIIKNTMVDPIEMTCSCCKSVFTYNFQDIQRKEEHMFLGLGSTVRRYVTCPVCKYDNDVNRVIVELQKDKEDQSEPFVDRVADSVSDNPDDPCPCYAKHCSSPATCCGCGDYDKWKKRQEEKK